MSIKIKAILLGLSAVLLFGTATSFTVAETKSDDKNLIEKIEIIEPKIDGSFFVSGDYYSDFSFTGVGIEWEGRVSPKDVRFYLKVLNDEKWGDWIGVEAEEQDTPDFYAENKNITDIIFIKGNGLKIKAEFLSDNKDIDKITLHYFFSVPKKRVGAAIAGDRSSVFARSSWINEEVSSSTRNSLWPSNYGDVKKIIIHHTGSALKDLNGDNVIGQADYEIAVQGVYNWHAKSLGWGDVGYNFIIDPNGKVYEGRFGGDGAVGGHAIRSATCSKYRAGVDNEMGFNKGTIGIAILGDSNKNFLSSAARESLINLITSKSVEFGIEPSGKSFFVDKEYPNIVGHLDVDCTNCPGTDIYSNLSYIRTTAQKRFKELGGLSASIPKVSFVGQSDTTVIIKKGEAKKIWIDFKNEGKTAWHNYTENKIYLAPTSVKQRFASLDSFNFAFLSDPALSHVTSYDLDRPNILPGETGRFTITINYPQNKIIDVKNLVLAWGNRAWFSGTELKITAASTEVDYGAALDSFTKSDTIFENNNHELVVKYLNIGAKTWTKEEITLALYDPSYASSSLKHDSWTKENSGIHPEEETIEPGSFATFNLPIKTGKTGIYDQVFFLIRKITIPGTDLILAEEKVVGSDHGESFLAESRNQAELSSSDFPEAVVEGSRPAVTLKFKNTGLTTWRGRGATILKVFDTTGEKSSFYDYRDWLNHEVAAWLVEGEVKPGEEGTFKMYLRIPKGEKDYNHQIILEQNKQRISINKKSAFDITTEVTK